LFCCNMHRAIITILLVGLAAADKTETGAGIKKFNVVTSTGFHKWANSNSPFSISISGKNGRSAERGLPGPRSKGDTKEHNLDFEDVGEIQCVTIRIADKAHDGWDINRVFIRDSKKEKELFDSGVVNFFLDNVKGKKKETRSLKICKSGKDKRGKYFLQGEVEDRCVKQDWDYNGGDIKKIAKVASIYACLDHCRGNSKCRSVAFDNRGGASQGNCWLKSKPFGDRLKYIKGVQSAQKSCSGARVSEVWSQYGVKYLSGYCSGIHRYATLTEAQTECPKRADCGGITFETQSKHSKKYTLRKGSVLKGSPSKEISYTLKTRWSQHWVKYLSGYSKGTYRYKTLAEAQRECLKRSDCGGITYETMSKQSKKYTLRKGIKLKGSPTKEVSWRKAAKRYTITFATDTEGHSQTNGITYVRLHGANGDSTEVEMNTERKQGTTDHHSVLMADVGKIKSVDVKLKGTNGWKINRVLVYSNGVEQYDSGVVKQWLDSKKPDETQTKTFSTSGGSRFKLKGKVDNCVKTDWDYWGADIKSLPGKKSDTVYTCLHKCRMQSGCKSVAFRTTDNRCFLKNKFNGVNSKFALKIQSANVSCAPPANCPPGKYQSGLQCQSCKANHYCKGGAGVGAKKCPAKSTSSAGQSACKKKYTCTCDHTATKACAGSKCSCKAV